MPGGLCARCTASARVIPKPGPSRPTWEQYALALAKTAGIRSEDPYVKVGAVVLRRDNSILGLGYNGGPSGIALDWSDREQRRKYVIHAETNALRFCNPGSARGGLMAVSGTPCPTCLTNAAAHGIRRVVFGELLDTETYPVDASLDVAKHLGIQLIHLPK